MGHCRDVARGEQEVQPLTDNRVVKELNRSLTPEQFDVLSRGFRPTSQNQKWYFFLEEWTFYFFWKRTGIYEVDVSETGKRYCLGTYRVDPSWDENMRPIEDRAFDKVSYFESKGIGYDESILDDLSPAGTFLSLLIDYYISEPGH